MPTLETERLLLRPLEMHDSLMMTTLVNDEGITSMMDEYPFPYPESEARAVVRWSQKAPREGKGYGLAMVRKEDKQLIGAIFLKLYTPVPEIGYWVGRPYWRQGYASEAANRVLQYGFEVFKFHRMSAYCFDRNVASQQVLEKIGMTLIRAEEYAVEGQDRVDVLLYYEIMQSEWKS
jgi:[ribosomal protein S5]-alanine N-acetyltransferase